MIHDRDAEGPELDRGRSSPPHRGDRPPPGARHRWSTSIHAPAGGATFRNVSRAAGRRRFYPRPRTGATRTGRLLDGHGRFQSTPPHRGRHSSRMVERWRAEFQSTPPHGGRRRGRADAPRHPEVSIHAPARGATAVARYFSHRESSFNPRPRTGGDRRADGRPGLRRGFNPRPRTGGDRGWGVSKQQQEVSIHAPARGATWRAQTAPGSSPCFNPRPRTGGDGSAWRSPAGPTRFNPRPRTGGDDRPQAAEPGGRVSIHAPARGATRPRSLIGGGPWGFNPRPRTGGDLRLQFVSHGGSPFQSTPPHGGRRAARAEARRRYPFQFTPPHGGRLGTAAD